MALTYNTGKYLLREIVGGTGFHNQNVTTYLALSTTKPVVAKSGVTGVTEPDPASYSRIKLGADNFTTEPSISEEGVISIANTGEMHFHEVTEEGGWGEIKYFAIYDSSAKGAGNCIYVGELNSYTLVTVTAETFDELKDLLYVRTGEGTSADPYVYTKVQEEDNFDASANYCEKKLVVEKGTVPLVRPGYLVISVK